MDRFEEALRCAVPSQLGTAQARTASPTRVLVADGYTDAADTLALLLQLLACEVRVCRNGPEALEAALDFQPDVILAEIVLPGMDGYQLARRLRENGIGALLVALSGLGDTLSRRKAAEAGFTIHVVKPIDLKDLQALVHARH